MKYRCAPMEPDSYCKQCKRFTEHSDSIIITFNSTDAGCDFRKIEKPVDLRIVAFRNYEERQ